MKQKKIVKMVIMAFAIVFLFGACRMINPSQMFRTGRSYNYSDFATTTASPQYQIAVNDRISFILSTNNGENLVNPVLGQNGGGATQLTSSKMLFYRIEQDGTTKLPVLGRVKLSGMTIREVEGFLEKEYSNFYNKPFVQLSVDNQRVFVFPGSITGDAKVLELKNSNTTLLEAIAESGGINGGKAHRIKLIRGDLKNPQVFLIDLSTIEGMKSVNLVLQANDIIYIESRDRLPSRVLETITPYLTLLSTVLIAVQIFK